MSPNPFAKEITITKEISKPLILELTDMHGRYIDSYKLDHFKNVINLSHLFNGIYLLMVKADDEVQNIKIIKQ
ncbi:MAG: T9SS type A sorting domain-containing protein [bacterium]|nr:T9SS type A sorting domain-containing protein [bacterium]